MGEIDFVRAILAKTKVFCLDGIGFDDWKALITDCMVDESLDMVKSLFYIGVLVFARSHISNDGGDRFSI